MTRPSDLLPHTDPSILLDEVLDVGAEGAVAALTIGPDTRYARPGRGVPAHVAIEWMAQTCGLYAGHDAVSARKPVRLGMLLGTRRFLATEAWFSTGERLIVTAKLALQVDGMGVFDCTVCDETGAERATARLTTYQVPESSP